MGHEVIIVGCIEGAGVDRCPAHNSDMLAALPAEDEWPALVRGMFALPAAWPHGTYRSQVIHFGASFKDEPQDRLCWDNWLVKFETLLRRLHWWSATLHLVTEFEPERVYRWVPTTVASDLLAADPLQCVRDWERSVVVIPDGRT